MRRGQGMDIAKLAGELIVPIVMLLFVAVYWTDAIHLSNFAKAFPFALTLVLVACLCGILVQTFRTRWRSKRDATAEEPLQAATFPARPVKVALQKAAIVGLPAALIFFWVELGGLLVMWGSSLVVLFLLGERRRLVLLLFPAVTSLAIYLLFRDVLYVRIPDGLLAIGG